MILENKTVIVSIFLVRGKMPLKVNSWGSVALLRTKLYIKSSCLQVGGRMTLTTSASLYSNSLCVKLD